MSRRDHLSISFVRLVWLWATPGRGDHLASGPDTVKSPPPPARPPVARRRPRHECLFCPSAAESKGWRDAEANSPHPRTPRHGQPDLTASPRQAAHSGLPSHAAARVSCLPRSSAAFLVPSSISPTPALIPARGVFFFGPVPPPVRMASATCSLPHGHSLRGSYSRRCLRSPPVGPACCSSSSSGSGTPSGFFSTHSYV